MTWRTLEDDEILQKDDRISISGEEDERIPEAYIGKSVVYVKSIIGKTLKIELYRPGIAKESILMKNKMAYYAIMREGSNDGFDNSPKEVHITLESAMNEAERLCKKTGKNFYVLKAIKVVRKVPTPLEWVDI